MKSHGNNKKKRIPISNEQTDTADILVGRNAVREALKGRRAINKILFADNAHGGSLHEIVELAKEKKVLTSRVPQKKIEQLCGTAKHQGIIAYVAPVEYADFDVVLDNLLDKEDPLLVILDELEDPHNLGAIIRTVDAVGADGVIIPKHRSCPLSSTVAKTSAGAIEYVPVMRVNNLARAMEDLKKRGFWIAGTDAEAKQSYTEGNFSGPMAIVIGSEGKGITRLVKEKCDYLLSIPMRGKVNSLNASNAAAILLYEVYRQRKAMKG